MGEQRKSFLEQVQSQIKSKEAKVFVSAELHHHLNKVKNYWLQKGISEDQAEEKALLKWETLSALVETLTVFIVQK